MVYHYTGLFYAVKYFHENAPTFILQITHVDKRKVWQGLISCKINFHVKAQKHEIHKKFHCQNKPVYSI